MKCTELMHYGTIMLVYPGVLLSLKNKEMSYLSRAVTPLTCIRKWPASNLAQVFDYPVVCVYICIMRRIKYR